VGTKLIMSVMQTHGVRRLVVESAFGAGDSLPLANWWQRLGIATLLWAPYEDKNLMEPEVKASGLEWTILRPTTLTNGAHTGRFVASVGRPPVKFSISREDVAAAMLQAVEERQWIGEAPAVTGA
jgi:hypothetical protein